MLFVKQKWKEKRVKKSKCSQKIWDFQKPTILRLLTQVILLQTCLGTAWPPQLLLKNHNHFICLRTNRGEKKRFQEWKDFTVITWSKWKNKMPALGIRRGTITTVKGKKGKWGSGSWERGVPKFQAHIGLSLNITWLEKNQNNNKDNLPGTFSFWHEKPDNLLNRNMELNIGYCVSLWDSYNYRKAVIKVTGIFHDGRSMWF